MKAEELLSRPGLRSGTFLVRKSASCPGSLALSVLDQREVFHYLIIGNSGGGGQGLHSSIPEFGLIGDYCIQLFL